MPNNDMLITVAHQWVAQDVVLVLDAVPDSLRCE